jgi:major membrane immunogen (membrane-anchored lipoprotein)
MKKASVFVIISLIILSSCSHKNEAIELSRDFFTALSDSTYGSPTDFYPRYDSLGIEAKSDIVDIEESDITEKNDTLIVRCYNNYTNSEGTFKQDSVTLFITRNEEKQFYIYDSKGLIVMDKDLEWFGTATGAFGKKLPNDHLSFPINCT